MSEVGTAAKTSVVASLPTLVILAGLAAGVWYFIKNNPLAKAGEGFSDALSNAWGAGSSIVSSVGDSVYNFFTGGDSYTYEELVNIQNETFEENKKELIDWLDSGGSDKIDKVNAEGATVPLGDSGVIYNASEWLNIRKTTAEKGAQFTFNPVTGAFDFTGSNKGNNSGVSLIMTKNEVKFPDFSHAAVLNRLKDSGWDDSNGSIENAASFLAEKSNVASREVVKNTGINNAGPDLLKTNYADGSFEVRDKKGQIVSSGSPGASGNVRTASEKAASATAYQTANYNKIAAATGKASADAWAKSQGITINSSNNAVSSPVVNNTGSSNKTGSTGSTSGSSSKSSGSKYGNGSNSRTSYF